MDAPPKPFVCTQCHQSFFGKDLRTGNPTSRYPLILTCGHTACLMCLKTASRNHKFYCCPSCQTETALPDGEESVSKLPPDLYVLGILSLSSKTFLGLGNREQNKLKLATSSTDRLKNSTPTPKPEQNGVTSTATCEECSLPARWWCKQCQAHFCSKCFDKIHKRSKFLKKHNVVPLHAQRYRSMVQKGCSIHSNSPVDFFCEDDDVLVCSTCAVQGDHKGHNCISLVEKNEGCLPELKLAMEEAQVVRARMKQSLKKIDELKRMIAVDVTPKEQEIRESFHNLHSALQVREAELLKQLHEYGQCNQTQLDQMAEDLSTSVKEISAHLSDAKMLQKCTYMSVNAVSLIKELKSAQNLPAFIVTADKEQSSISVHLSQKLFQHIKLAGSIDADIHSRYRALPESELPDDFVIEPVQDEFLTDTESSPSINDQMTEVVLAPSDSSENTQPTKFRFIKPRHSKLLRHEHVKVVHIRDPGCFFVQYCKNANDIRILGNNIQKMEKNFISKENIPSAICEGLLYLVQYKDGKWYRAKVNKVLSVSSLDLVEPSNSNCVDNADHDLLLNNEYKEKCEMLNNVSSLKSDARETALNQISDGDDTLISLETNNQTDSFGGTSINVTADQLVEVTYMDYGNPDIVPVEKIRNIPSKLMSHSFFAHQCSLWDIIPSDPSSGWSQESTSAFVKFVDRHKILMSVIEDNSGVLYVDLNQPAHMDVTNDMPVSVREALIFMEHAQYPNIGATRETDKRVNYMQYFPPEPIQPGEKVNVMVTHIENPGDFYVMLQGGVCSYFYSMFGELQSYYGSAQGNTLSVFAPREGQPYVALYPEDQKWYRAKVEKLVGGSQVIAKFVDYGNTSLIPHWNLRKIVDQFIKVPIQAVQCAMADIAPLSASWDEQCSAWLLEETRGKSLQMIVHKRSTGDKQVVSLFQWGENHDICLNALMVKSKMACTTGPGSAIVEIPRPELKLVEPVEVPEPKSMPSEIRDILTWTEVPSTSWANTVEEYEKETLWSKKPSSDKKNRKTDKFVSKKNYVVAGKTPLDLLREANRKHSQSTAAASAIAVPDSTSAKTEKPRSKKRGLPVKIVRFDNPGLFYTQKVDEEPKLTKLMKDLINYHESDESEHLDLKVGSLVAALNPEDHNSFRARIKEINREKESVKVFLVDYGWDIEVPLSNLKTLPPVFCRDLAYATPCHLVGLIPAGGQKWTRSACDFAQDHITQFSDQFLVIKKVLSPEEGKDSVPVDILLKELKIGGALEPSVTKYHSLTELLMEHGFALSAEKFNKLRNKPKVPEVVQSAPKELSESESEDTLETIISQGSEIQVTSGEESQTPSTSLLSNVSDSESDWKPAIMPESMSFMAYPTYVGYDGCIYLHTKEGAHDVLENISSSLCSIFMNDVYQKPKSVIKVGQMCVARFEVDKKWYRGKVHKVADECLEVIFVDYGNLELVSFQDVRLYATHVDIPIQCWECELHNVRPISENGQWPTSTLDYIHKLVVEKLVLVTIKEPPVPGKRLKVNVILTGGDTVTEILVKEKLAHIVQPNLMLLSGAIDNPYKTLPYPSLGCTFRVVVTHMIEPSLVCLQRPKTEAPSDELEVLVNKELDFFLEMCNKLAESAPKQPPLRKLTVGEACLGQYSFDGYWYRCVIVNCDDEKATVVFIDYGNSETIPINSKRLRKIPSEFMQVKAQALTCRLYGVVSPDGDWSLAAHEAMKNLLFPTDAEGQMIELVAQVMDYRKPIEIILTEEGNSSQPIYQHLIDDNILATRI